ncbi:helix-turn-helix domain-containing protein [Streptomyces sp. C1-2]|uniref:helix-turn-helix domain-containing protein n=1 Tax=Streptomyces sp. C1-2 TaxID=2720022 RepID=UPI00143253AE|nr:helix-turn-helix domain-containing protein [Streptomyces sp. C1-2]
MFDSPDFDFDVTPYAGVDAERLVRHTYCSGEASAWRSLLVQCFTHAREVERLELPGTSDLHLVLCTHGDAVMRTGTGGGRAVRRRWVPGRMELMVPGRPTTRGYRTASTLRTTQVHIPRATVDRTAAQLGVGEPDFEALAAHLGEGDAAVEHVVRALPAAPGTSDLYAESAASFLTTHLLTGGRGQAPPGPERTAVRTGIAIMRERLADPLTLADLTAEVHLSVYHFIRVFREATGETPHRYLTRLRIERARHLLTSTTLTVGQIAERCGFSGPGALSAAFLSHVGVRPSVYRKNA